MSFPCHKCGGCCRLIGHVAEMKAYDRGDGACIHLADDNSCRIYETRPDVCRVDKMQPQALTVVEWYRRNEVECGRIHLAVYGSPLVGLQ